VKNLGQHLNVPSDIFQKHHHKEISSLLLPSSIEEVSDVLNFLKPINTSKDEDLLLVNDADSRIVIFSSPTNLKFLCDDRCPCIHWTVLTLEYSCTKLVLNEIYNTAG
jgi:hypothetical protein